MDKNIRVLSRRNFVELLVATGIVTTGSVALGGCAQKDTPAVAPATDGADQTQKPYSNVVVDAKGNEFTIPDKIDRIAITCQGGTAHDVAIFGAADKIVAMPPMKSFPQFLKMYPELKDVISAGSFDDLNLEVMLAQEPDIALVGIKSEKGNAQIADMGIPIYVMLIGWAAIDTLKQEFLNVGKILGNEEKAQRLVAHWDDKLTLVKERVSKIPEDKRKKVYYLSGPDITKANTGDWGRTWIDVIGAQFAVPENNLNGDVTVEKALEWDPDIIVVQGGKDINELYKAEQIQELSAIKNSQVYSIPIGGFWWDRPSPEATLGFLWLAQTVYPEYMKDVDLKAETKAFFKEFYEYDLSDSEYEAFLSA